MSTMRTLATVAVFAVGFSFVSTTVLVSEAVAERKGFMDRTWNWGNDDGGGVETPFGVKKEDPEGHNMDRPSLEVPLDYEINGKGMKVPMR